MLTLADAKQALKIDPSDVSQDDELQPYVDAVTTVVERQTGEVVDQRTVTEQHHVHRQSALMLASIPVVSLTEVSSSDGSRTWPIDELHVNTTTGRLVSLTAPFDGLITVTVEAGYADVPPNYHVAALMILEQLWRAQRGPSTAAFGDGPSLGEVPLGFAVPRRAAELLGSAMGGIA